jgi:hypothetical protein
MGMPFFGRSRRRDQERVPSIDQLPSSLREEAYQLVHEVAVDDHVELVEVEVVGESYRQEALASIAGPKGPDGKRVLTGATLRCEPDNPHDPNAIRVEVMGQHVGYVGRDAAGRVSRALQEHANGVVEGRGLVVGGWKTDERDQFGQFQERSEGHYGIRVWLTRDDVTRLGVRATDLDPKLRPPWPTLPPVAGNERRWERRTDPGSAYFDSVTVTCEEHYQEAILASLPDRWEPDWSWPVLVELRRAEANPHARRAEACVQLFLMGQTVGYFTTKMSARYLSAVDTCASEGSLVTAQAVVSMGAKGGAEVHRLKVDLPAVR